MTSVLDQEPGGTREAARDIVYLYGNLAVVYLPAVTPGFARYLLAFAVERLKIVTGPGPAVPVAVHTSTGQKFGHLRALAGPVNTSAVLQDEDEDEEAQEDAIELLESREDAPVLDHEIQQMPRLLFRLR